MAQLKELADKRSALFDFDPRRLKVKPGLNCRDFTLPENIAYVEELIISIAENGVVEPLKIFRESDEEIFIANGECRWRACMALIERGTNIETVPCLPEPRGTSPKDRIVNQVLSNTSKAFAASEYGAAIKKHIALGGSAAEFSAKIGKSVTWVNNALDFSAAPIEVHAAVQAGEISPTLAAKITREEGPAKAAEAVKAAVDTAKARGKTKATPKDAKPSKLPKEPRTMKEKTVNGRKDAENEYELYFKGMMFKASAKEWHKLSDDIAEYIPLTIKDLEA